MAKLLIVFPGIGYTKDRPLLYYGAKIAKEQGYTDVINVSYSYEKAGLMGNEEKMKAVFLELYNQAKDALKDVEFKNYSDICFISKSIGTAIALAFSDDNKIDVRHILYTPLELSFTYKVGNGIAFTGTSDPWVTHENIVRLSYENNVPLTIIQGANHSLEVEDTAKNIKILGNVMKITEDFLKG